MSLCESVCFEGVIYYFDDQHHIEVTWYVMSQKLKFQDIIKNVFDIFTNTDFLIQCIYPNN